MSEDEERMRILWQHLEYFTIFFCRSKVFNFLSLLEGLVFVVRFHKSIRFARQPTRCTLICFFSNGLILVVYFNVGKIFQCWFYCGVCSHGNCFGFYKEGILLFFLSFSLCTIHGRRDYRGNDLRDKLERRQSPYRRSSPGKYVRGRETFQHKRDRGYSPSRSPGSGRQQKRPHMNGQSDFSESLGYSDDADERRDDTRMHSNNDKDDTEEQLRQVQMDVEMLEAHKCELETTLEKTAEEAESLAARNEELEAQLNQVEEESKRIVSKIKKFVKAYNRYTQAQDELKRTEARLRKFGDQLSLDASKAFASEDNSSLNFLSDVDADEGAQEEQIQSSPNRKMPRLDHGVNGDAKPALLRRRGMNLNEKIRSAKFRVTDGSAALTKNYGNDTKPSMKGSSAKTGHVKPPGPPPYVLDKVGKTGSQGNCVIDKVKSSDPGHALPATSMAAHAMDEFVEVVEIDDRLKAQDPTNASAPGILMDKTSERALSIPPLPTGPLNAGNKYKGGDEDALANVVDREGGAIDLNCDIEIE